MILNKFEKVWYKNLPAIIYKINNNIAELKVLFFYKTYAFWITQVCSIYELSKRDMDFSEQLFYTRET